MDSIALIVTSTVLSRSVIILMDDVQMTVRPDWNDRGACISIPTLQTSNIREKHAYVCHSVYYYFMPNSNECKTSVTETCNHFINSLIAIISQRTK